MLKDELLKTYRDMIAKEEELDDDDIYDKYTLEMKRREWLCLKAELKRLEAIHKEKYEKGGCKPTIGDGRYYRYPDKDLIDHLRVGQYEIDGKDLNINKYIDYDDVFNNHSILIGGNAYCINGETPYKLKVNGKGNETSLMVSISSNLLLDETRKKHINFLASFIEQSTGSPINLIYSDSMLETISFARINKKRILGYHAFLNDYNDYLVRDVIYIGSELKDCFSQEEIDLINKYYVFDCYGIIELKHNMRSDELNSFNNKVKSIILNYK